MHVCMYVLYVYLCCAHSFKQLGAHIQFMNVLLHTHKLCKYVCVVYVLCMHVLCLHVCCEHIFKRLHTIHGRLTTHKQTHGLLTAPIQNHGCLSTHTQTMYVCMYVLCMCVCMYRIYMCAVSTVSSDYYNSWASYHTHTNSWTSYRTHTRSWVSFHTHTQSHRRLLTLRNLSMSSLYLVRGC
jgi:hypothetical protein